jgi:hypothetical protein
MFGGSGQWRTASRCMSPAFLTKTWVCVKCNQSNLGSAKMDGEMVVRYGEEHLAVDNGKSALEN